MKGVLKLKQEAMDKFEEAKEKFREFEEKDTVDNKLELIKYTTEVQSRIKTDISSDFILAKLGDKDKEAIVEMTANAYYCKKIIETMSKKAKKYEWDREKSAWKKIELPEKEKELIKGYAQATFDAFMVRLYMTVLLNRNVPKNYLIRILAGYDDTDEERASSDPTTQSKLDKIREEFDKKLKGEK